MGLEVVSALEEARETERAYKLSQQSINDANKSSDECAQGLYWEVHLQHCERISVQPYLKGQKRTGLYPGN